MNNLFQLQPPVIKDLIILEEHGIAGQQKHPCDIRLRLSLLQQMLSMAERY